ncbi:G-protein coupled receptor 4-like [Amia ocellicauda]|uniref:G-protein coupled receptor 4-like n=1 Tax=Amia ocellicauda TaxID=2972642 RepID=UPI003464E08C
MGSAFSQSLSRSLDAHSLPERLSQRENTPTPTAAQPLRPPSLCLRGAGESSLVDPSEAPRSSEETQRAEQTSTRQPPLTMNNSNTTGLDTDSQDNLEYSRNAFIFIIVMRILNVVIGLPANCLAICSLYRMIRADMVVPIYIINLLISDLLQIIARIVRLILLTLTHSERLQVAKAFSFSLFILGLSASIGFMLCIALERYLVVAHPLWYRCRRSIRHTTLVSVGVWVSVVILTAVVMPLYFMPHFQQQITISFSVLFLLPFPLLLFFFFGTWRAIAGATSVRDEEKRRIVRTLALVLGTYTVLFLPYCIA